MNMSAEDMDRIKEQLANETGPQDPMERAMESAEIIRQNIASIKGDRYLGLVEAAVLIHKQTKLMAFIAHQFISEDQLEAIGHIHSQINARIIDITVHIYDEDFSPSDAKELMIWVDRISNAEDAGIRSEIDNLIPRD